MDRDRGIFGPKKPMLRLYNGRAMVHTFTNVCKSRFLEFPRTMARKTKQQALETRQHILDVALRLFSERGVSSTSLADIAHAAGVTRGAIYWHFKNKPELFSEIWQSSEAGIGEVEIEYRAKFPDDPLSVLRELLVYILEAVVVEERRRLMMEIIFHKCEFVGEMAIVRDRHRKLGMHEFDKIEGSLQHCMNAGLLPERLQKRRAAILIRSYICGLMETWLFSPERFDLQGEARTYVAVLIDMLLLSPALQSAES